MVTAAAILSSALIQLFYFLSLDRSNFVQDTSAPNMIFGVAPVVVAGLGSLICLLVGLIYSRLSAAVLRRKMLLATETRDSLVQELSDLESKLSQERGERSNLETASRKLESEVQKLAAELVIERDKILSLEVARKDAEARALELKTELATKLAQAESNDRVIKLLARLQQKGRFVDFMMEDISQYSDEQVGAGARVVQQGCAAVVKEFVEFEPVHLGVEGEQITIEQETSPGKYRLIGSIGGNPPFSGTLLHRGWRARKINSPSEIIGLNSIPEDGTIIAPAEVEVGV